VEEFTETLTPHLQHTIQQLSEMKVVRIGTWLPDFETALSQAVNKALLLKGRFAVAPERYSMVWYASKTLFNRRMMKDLNEAPADRSGLNVAVTLFPGWMKGDEVIARAQVKLDVMTGEI